MNLSLIRTAFRIDGIFGELRDDSDTELFITLEHSYDLVPKIPDGVYKCIRGIHQLEHMADPFETFEITEVPNHTEILFHVGNANVDSAGCVLLGMTFAQVGGAQWITQSQHSFERFMILQTDCDEFELTVKSN